MANLNGEKIRVVTLVDQAGANDTYLYEMFKGTSVQLASPELGLNASGAGELNTGWENTILQDYPSISPLPGKPTTWTPTTHTISTFWITAPGTTTSTPTPP